MSLIRYLVAVVFFVTPIETMALPFENKIITVNKRNFFVGDVPKPAEDHDRSFLFKQSPWLDSFVNGEPFLFDQNVEFFRSGISAEELVGQLPRYVRKAGSATLVSEAENKIDGYETYRYSSIILHFFPKDSSLTFSVICAEDLTESEFSLCHISAVYPYDTHVVLIAKEFFPGTLNEIGWKFDDMAQRMVEIAICLDVTEESVSDWPESLDDILEQNPGFLDCEIPLTS